MGIASVRSAFLAAADRRLRLDHAGLSYQNSHQVLSFTGWHADGVPFAMVTAPFDDDPVLRAARVARDIIAAYVGRPAAPPINQLRSKIAMSQKGSGLARLMGGLRSLDVDADALAGRLEAAMANLSAEMATTTQIVGNVESSVDDLRAVNALYSNGAPNPTPGSSGPPQG
jgi:hypothetical protein